MRQKSKGVIAQPFLYSLFHKNLYLKFGRQNTYMNRIDNNSFYRKKKKNAKGKILLQRSLQTGSENLFFKIKDSFWKQPKRSRGNSCTKQKFFSLKNKIRKKEKAKKGDKSFLHAADAKARGDKGFRLDSFSLLSENHRRKYQSYPRFPHGNHETATENDMVFVRQCKVRDGSL